MLELPNSEQLYRETSSPSLSQENFLHKELGNIRRGIDSLQQGINELQHRLEKKRKRSEAGVREPSKHECIRPEEPCTTANLLNSTRLSGVTTFDVQPAVDSAHNTIITTKSTSDTTTTNTFDSITRIPPNNNKPSVSFDRRNYAINKPNNNIKQSASRPPSQFKYSDLIKESTSPSSSNIPLFIPPSPSPTPSPNVPTTTSPHPVSPDPPPITPPNLSNKLPSDIPSRTNQPLINSENTLILLPSHASNLAAPPTSTSPYFSIPNTPQQTNPHYTAPRNKGMNNPRFSKLLEALNPAAPNIPSTTSVPTTNILPNTSNPTSNQPSNNVPTFTKPAVPFRYANLSSNTELQTISTNNSSIRTADTTAHSIHNKPYIPSNQSVNNSNNVNRNNKRPLEPNNSIRNNNTNASLRHNGFIPASNPLTSIPNNTLPPNPSVPPNDSLNTTTTSTSSSDTNSTSDTSNETSLSTDVPLVFPPLPEVQFPPTLKLIANSLQSCEGLPFLVKIVHSENLSQFFNEWAAKIAFAWCLMYKSSVTEKNPGLLNNADEDEDEFLPSKCDIRGICVCWDSGAVVYFLPLRFSWPGSTGAEEIAMKKDPNHDQILLDEAKILEHRWLCLKMIMEQSRASKVLFNMKSQLKMLMARGIFTNGPVEDPKIAAWMVDADKNKERSLYELLHDYSKQKSAVFHDIKFSKQNGGFDFSCVKAHHSLLLSRVLKDKFAASKQIKVYQKIEMPLIPVLANMEFDGIGFKNEVIQKNEQVITAKQTYLEQRAHELAGKTFDLANLTEISDILYNVLKLPKPQDEVRNVKRARKHYSTKQELLTKLASYHEVPVLVMEWRKLRHLKSCYLEMLGLHSFYDPRFNMYRIYSTILQTSAPTGRLAMNYPNLQSISNEVTFSLPPAAFLRPPEKDSLEMAKNNSNSNNSNSNGSNEKEGNTNNNTGNNSNQSNSSNNHNKKNNKNGSAERDPNASALGELDLSFVQKHVNKINNEMVVSVKVRDAFVPAEGCLFLAADYCQIEFRIMAYLSHDDKLMALLNQKQDVFKLIAAQVSGTTIDRVTESERGHAKELSYGMLYGMGMRSLADKLNMSESDAANYKKAFLKKFDGFANFFEKVTKDCEKNGFVETRFGRRRYLPLICSPDHSTKHKAVRQAINTVCQGTAADIMKKAMVVTVTKIKQDPKMKARMLLQLHDEIVFEVDKNQIKELHVLVKTTMESIALKQVGFLPVKVCVGKSWGTLELMEDPRNVVS